MSQLLLSVGNVSVLVFALSSMFGAGLSQRLQDITNTLRTPGILLRVIVANFLLVPLLGFALIRLLDPPQALAMGVFLAASAAGAPFLVKLTEVADADLALGTTLLVVLLPLTIVYMPLVIPLALPRAETTMAIVARPLLLTMLLPLALGMLLRRISEPWSVLLRPFLSMISSIALVVLIAAFVLADLPAIVQVFSTSASIAGVLLVGGAFIIGCALGGPSWRSREVLGLATAQRNISAAAVVASQALANPHTTTMVIVISLIGFAVLFPSSAMMRKSRD